MKKRIAIIGAGIGGLSTGCCAQMNGYDTDIFEMHTVPGGVCTSWKRSGYVFDGCLHHFPGCKEGSRFHDMWKELGIMPGLEVIYPKDLVQVEAPGGKTLTVSTDLGRLEQHVREVAREDAPLLAKWVEAMRSLAGSDVTEMVLATSAEKLQMLRKAPFLARWGRYTLESFADKRLADPFMRKAFPTILYDTTDNPLLIQMNLLAACSIGQYGWTVGGSMSIARAMERSYQGLGGSIHYKARVAKVLVENDRAVGVRLEDGTEHRADVVVSNAYGRTTIFDMLDGRYASKAWTSRSTPSTGPWLPRASRSSRSC
jgi:phytoene dehydrogenase-like protein